MNRKEDLQNLLTNYKSDLRKAKGISKINKKWLDLFTKINEPSYVEDVNKKIESNNEYIDLLNTLISNVERQLKEQ